MIRGERFEIDLDAAGQNDAAAPAPFIADVLERKVSAPKPPSLPTARKQVGGFPRHVKRHVGPSVSKSQDDGEANLVGVDRGQSAADVVKSSTTPRSWEEEEKARIDVENRQRLAAMTDGEIEVFKNKWEVSCNYSLTYKTLINIQYFNAFACIISHQSPVHPALEEYLMRIR